MRLHTSDRWPSAGPTVTRRDARRHYAGESPPEGLVATLAALEPKPGGLGARSDEVAD
jgi:hypothetical protein